MKHIVFILGNYYPNYSAVGKCLGNIADVLVSEYKVTVICTKTSLSESEIAYHNNQKIMRVTTNYLQKRMLVEKNLQEVNGLKNIGMKILWQGLKLYRLIKTLISRKTIDSKLVDSYQEALWNIREPIDIIIPTCSPFDSIVAAMRYKEIDSDVEIIPYVFDLFAKNLNLNRVLFNQKIKLKNNMYLEEEMLKKSKAIFHVANWTKYFRKYYYEYSEKTILVEHPLLRKKYSCIKENERIYDKDVDRENRKETFNLIFAGSLLKGYVDADYILKLFNTEKMQNFELDFYSQGNGCNIVENIVAPNIRFKGWVPHMVLEDAYKNASAFISIAEKSGKQISSKIFEYMAFGKPIVHIYYDEFDENVKYLKKYPLALCVKADEKKIEYNQKRIKLFLDTGVNQNIDLTKVYLELRECTPGYIATIISSVIEDKGRVNFEENY